MSDLRTIVFGLLCSLLLAGTAARPAGATRPAPCGCCVDLGPRPGGRDRRPDPGSRDRARDSSPHGEPFLGARPRRGTNRRAHGDDGCLRRLQLHGRRARCLSPDCVARVPPGPLPSVRNWREPAERSRARVHGPRRRRHQRPHSDAAGRRRHRGARHGRSGRTTLPHERDRRARDGGQRCGAARRPRASHDR